MRSSTAPASAGPCWPCNERKGDLTLDQLSWQLMPTVDSNWVGLTEHYLPLWHLAGRPTSDAHPAWLKAVGQYRGAGSA